MSELTDQIKVVVEARKLRDIALVKRNLARDEWENQNEDLLRAVTNQVAVVDACETLLRNLTLKDYAVTGNKAPAPGVGIREVTKLGYDNKVAYDWAVKHTMALKLDSRAFEKIVKASPLDFVTVTQEPQATISANLTV